jgi:hypothetical protein
MIVRLLTCAAIVSGLVLSSAAAGAVSITNADDRDHKVTVIEGDSASDHVLKPAQALSGICPKGCIIRLNDSDDDLYKLDRSDVVSIEDGTVYYEGPDTSGETGPAGGRSSGKQ